MRVIWKPFTVCRLAGVPVQFHVTWFLYPAGFLIWLFFDCDRPWTLYCVLLLLLGISVSELTHEFAHVLAARRCGINTRRVLFFPLGALAELESELVPPNEFWIALAGPLASLALAGIFWEGFHAFASWNRTWHVPWLYHCMRNLQLGSTLNLYFALFNLLPCFPMDGGRILRSSLAMIIGRLFPQQAGHPLLVATRITVRYVSWPMAMGVMTYSVLRFDLVYSWIYLILFPLLLCVAEIEYRELCDNERSGVQGNEPTPPEFAGQISPTAFSAGEFGSAFHTASLRTGRPVRAAESLTVITPRKSVTNASSLRV